MKFAMPCRTVALVAVLLCSAKIAFADSPTYIEDRPSCGKIVDKCELSIASAPTASDAHSYLQDIQDALNQILARNPGIRDAALDIDRQLLTIRTLPDMRSARIMTEVTRLIIDRKISMRSAVFLSDENASDIIFLDVSRNDAGGRDRFRRLRSELISVIGQADDGPREIRQAAPGRGAS